MATSQLENVGVASYTQGHLQGDVPIELVVLGVGAGATCVYTKQCSSSFAIVVGENAVLLADVGLGVTSSALQYLQRVPSCFYISHNHSDHAGELPVLLTTQSKVARPRVIAAPQVMQRLKQHRLHELHSTGCPLELFGQFEEVQEGQNIVIGSGLSLVPCKSRHSELCFGFILFHNDKPILGWTADSGFDRNLYEKLAVAPTLLLDARATGSSEHASFEEISQLALDYPPPGHKLLLTGYGASSEAPKEDIPGFVVVQPGQRIRLKARS